jgi:hypothetical protein
MYRLEKGHSQQKEHQVLRSRGGKRLEMVE